MSCGVASMVLTKLLSVLRLYHWEISNLNLCYGMKILGEGVRIMEGNLFWILISITCTYYWLKDSISRSHSYVLFALVPSVSYVLFDINNLELLFSFRYNRPGTISGRQLGEAANRLVVNSLQAQADYSGYGNQTHGRPPSYAGPQYHTPQSSYTNHRIHDQGHHRMPPPRGVHPPEGQYQSSNRSTSFQSHQNDNDYNNRRSYNERHNSSGGRHHHNGSQSQYYERNNRMAPQHSTNPTHLQYQSGTHHNVGPLYPNGPVAQTPPGFGANPYQSGYNQYQNYQSAGATGHQNQWRDGGAGWVPPPQAGSGVARGYGHPHQSGNQFYALDRRANRRPPPAHGYGRN